MTALTMKHWNYHQMCAIDIETSGLDPKWDQILQIAIVPLNSNFEQRKDVPPLNLFIRPDDPESISREALRINKIDLDRITKFGHDMEKAKDMLDHWINKLDLGYTKFGQRKRILPLAHNWQFDSGFIKNWLGPERYSSVFDSRCRDTQVAAEYLNDRAAMHAERVPFSKVSLYWLCKELGVVNKKAHDAVQDCLATAECYRILTLRGLLG